MPQLEDRVTKSTKGDEAESAPAPRVNKKSRQQMLDGVLKGEVAFSSFLSEHPEIVMQMAERAYVLFQEGAFDKAEQIFQGLAVIMPDEAYYRTALGSIWLAQSKLDEAEKAFDEAIRLNPKWGPPLVSRGELHLRKGRLMDAASDFEKAIELDPETKEPETKHARLLAAATLANIRMALAAKQAEAAGGQAGAAGAAAPAPAAAPKAPATQAAASSAAAAPKKTPATQPAAQKPDASKTPKKR
jgi:tetratricopeptide (TPR) repeat protein